MKKFLLILLLCVAIPISISWGQGIQTGKTFMFGGVRHDYGVLVSFGVGQQLKNHLWTVNYGNLGYHYGSVANELVFFMTHFHKTPEFHLGLLAGVNTNWVDLPDNSPAMAYVGGAVGGIGAYDITKQFGVWGYGKGKFNPENPTGYPDGITYGGGLYVMF